MTAPSEVDVDIEDFNKEDDDWEKSINAMHWEPLPSDGTPNGRRLL